MERTNQQSAGTITLIGSGEMSRSMGKVHRTVMSRIEGPVRAVFLDTPAGFELNADHISDKAVEYFEKRLNLDLQIASFKSAAAATSAEIAAALKKIRSANYIFAGPGSPTYVVDNWRDTVIFAAMAQRLARGAHLVLASSAAIAMGRYALPVYEIYKVGEAPHWVEGLDLLDSYGFDLAIMPHWNNSEGGTYDTRYCFMGAPRWKLLEERLPDSTTILGVDEYTACILDLSSGHGHVLGAGGVTIRRKCGETIHANGTTFDLEQLRSGESKGEPAYSLATRKARAEPAEELYYELPPEWDISPDPQAPDLASSKALIELLVDMRAKIREGENWALADEIRDRLSDLGILLEDGPEGTSWRRD